MSQNVANIDNRFIAVVILSLIAVELICSLLYVCYVIYVMSPVLNYGNGSSITS